MKNEAQTAIAALRGRRVLVVDDNDFNLDVAQGLLCDIGIQVDVATNGALAIEALKTATYDAVLMDVQMPVMDGHEATRQIRKNPALAQTVVLAMTANAGPEDRELCLQAGMSDVLTKPIEPDTLFVTLAHWIQTMQSHPGSTPTPQVAAGSNTAAQDTAMTSSLDAFPVWDASALGRIVGDNLSIQSRLLDKYLLTASEVVSEIRASAAAGDWPQVSELAHKLKSSSRSIGAQRLGALCEALERSGRTGAISQSEDLTPQVLQGFDQVQQLLRDRA